VAQEITHAGTMSNITGIQISRIPELQQVIVSIPHTNDEPLDPTLSAAYTLQKLLANHTLAARQKNTHLNELDDQIFDRTLAELNMYGHAIGTHAQQMLLKIQAANKNHEITLLPTFFNNALLIGRTNKDTCLKLGVANVYCWLAYTLYDHMLDDKTNTEYIPLANIARQRSRSLYHSTCNEPNMRNFIDHTFMQMDAANAWETAHARFSASGTVPVELPDFGDGHQLAHRSFAHVLGPLIIVHQQAQTTPLQRQLLHQSLTYYLIARQLNDDAHDWQDDIQNGELTYVVTNLLQRMPHAGQRVQEIMPKLQTLFWREASVDICQLILSHVARGKKLLAATNLIKSDSSFTQLYDDIAAAAHNSQTLRQNGIEFAQKFADENPSA
jgi:hypothetical protein